MFFSFFLVSLVCFFLGHLVFPFSFLSLCPVAPLVSSLSSPLTHGVRLGSTHTHSARQGTNLAQSSSRLSSLLITFNSFSFSSHSCPSPTAASSHVKIFVYDGGAVLDGQPAVMADFDDLHGF